MEQDIKLNISHHSNLRLAKLKKPGHQVFTHTYACSACTYAKHTFCEPFLDSFKLHSYWTNLLLHACSELHAHFLHVVDCAMAMCSSYWKKNKNSVSSAVWCWNSPTCSDQATHQLWTEQEPFHTSQLSAVWMHYIYDLWRFIFIDEIEMQRS